LFHICKEIDKKMEGSKEEENYDFFYRHVCSYSHFNALGFDKHVIKEIGGKKLIDIKICSGQEHVNAAISFSLAIFQHITLSFDLGLEESLEDLQKEHRSETFA